jgi:protease IV
MNDSKNNVVWILVGFVAVIFIFGTFLGNALNSSGSKTSNVLVVEISGEITSVSNQGFFSSGVSSQDIVSQLNKANTDKSISGVLLRINSPGGTPVASHEIVRAVKSLDKPVVSVIRDVGASGAYWVASSSDFIVSDELSLTGSVGVLGGFFDFHGFLEKYNVSYERFTGGEYKDLGSSYREISDVERDMLQAKIDLMHQFFLNDVIVNRNLNNESIAIVSTGVYFVGIEALDLGLVDLLGDESFAVNYLENLFESNVRLIERPQRQGLFNLFASLNSGPFRNFGVKL